MARTPLWQSIAANLRQEIDEGHFPPGQKLPTEAQLSSRFGVNRHTVRRALGALAEEGAVFSRRGSGVYVAHVSTDYALGPRVRFHQNLEAEGRIPGKSVLALDRRPADAEEAEALQLAPGTEVYAYHGLSKADDMAIAVFLSVFPAARLPRLEDALLASSSVTAALRAHGIADYTRAWTRLSARGASSVQAAQLHLREGAPLIFSVGVNVDPDGVAIEYGRTWFAGDRVTLTLAGAPAG